jgi:hypothetical protein
MQVGTAGASACVCRGRGRGRGRGHARGCSAPAVVCFGWSLTRTWPAARTARIHANAHHTLTQRTSHTHTSQITAANKDRLPVLPDLSDNAGGLDNRVYYNFLRCAAVQRSVCNLCAVRMCMCTHMQMHLHGSADMAVQLQYA